MSAREPHRNHTRVDPMDARTARPQHCLKTAGLAPAALPECLRRLSPEEVAADQRRRALAALAELVADTGYSGLSVQQIIDRAGISRKTFYELFAGKAEAYRTARDEALERLSTEVCAELSPGLPWPAAVSAALGEALRWAANEPHPALLLAAPIGVGPLPGECDNLLCARFAPGLRRGRERAAAELPTDLEGALIGGLTATIEARLRRREQGALPGLTSVLTRFVLAPYLGPAKAARAASRA